MRTNIAYLFDHTPKSQFSLIYVIVQKNQTVYVKSFVYPKSYRLVTNFRLLGKRLKRALSRTLQLVDD
jgi:hypothetical protein